LLLIFLKKKDRRMTRDLQLSKKILLQTKTKCGSIRNVCCGMMRSWQSAMPRINALD